MTPGLGEESFPFTLGGEEEHKEEEHHEEVVVSNGGGNESSYQGTVANIRYNRMAHPWNSPLAFGVQAFVEYNGLIMNDRYRGDVIRIVSITGLDDAEVRDAREPRASAHGEFPYDAFYGGRNLVLTGFIESGSVQVLEYLRQTLKAAFAPLTESPLKFRWFDIRDTFVDPQSINQYVANATETSGNYSTFIGSIANLKAENSLIRWASAGEDYVLRTAEQRKFCDAVATLKFVLGEQESKSSLSILGSVVSEKSYIKYTYNQNQNSPYIRIEVVNNGEVFPLFTEIELSQYEVFPVMGQTLWLRGRKEGNYLTVELWDTEPQENSLPTVSYGKTLVGPEAEVFGDKILTSMGFGGKQEDTTWNIDEFSIESMYPGYVVFNARKLNSISIKDEQFTLSKFKRPFQITMRTSDFRAFSSAQSRGFITPTLIYANPVFGRKYPRAYPLKYSFSIAAPGSENMLNVHNRGTVFVEPLIKIHGPMQNIVITNLTNGASIEWLGTISATEEIIIDCKEETIENLSGNNLLEFLSGNPEWIKLDPGWNDIFISYEKYEGAISPPTMTVFYNHGYM